MTSNLKQLKNDIKKRSILIGIAALLVSCGGGGGGGGGSTSAATPTTPSTPTTPATQPTTPAPVTNKPTVTTAAAGLTWNDTTLSYNKDNPHNNSNTALTGSNVKVGIIDVGFENSTFSADLTQKFGSRLTKLTVPGFTSQATASDDHGIVVAAAKHEADKGTYPHVTLDMYQQLKNHGITIYNQSFGIDGVVTDFTSIPTSSRYYGYQIGNDILNFYKNEVNNGSLFVWAAGNDSSDKQPTLEGGLPYFENSLQKGWINVVALTSKVESKLDSPFASRSC